VGEGDGPEGRRAGHPREPWAHGSHPLDPAPVRTRRVFGPGDRPPVRGRGHGGRRREAEATAALGQAAPERLIADLRAGIDELERRQRDAKLAVIGFCFGGGLTWQLLAAGEPRLAAAAPFYGPAPASPDFSGSKAAVLAVYGELDSRVNATRDGAVAALDAAGLKHEVRTFPGADHAFFNDTGPRYNATAAGGAYQTVLVWFARYLA
jgi:carboxymethylenebutenolidase